jgi:DNA-binding transcriptional LysR family regulator
MTPLDLRELHYFAVLARELHFGRAAERLYLDRSGLRKAIGRMEATLGVSLFSRAGGGVALTPAGVALLERSDEVMRAFDRVKAIADAAHDGAAGTLAIASSPEVRYEVVSPILKRFARTFPDVAISRREQAAESIIDDVLDGARDVGIAICVPATTGLSLRRLKDVELRALVASTSPLAGRERIAIEELRHERLLMAPGNPSVGLAACARAILEAARVNPRYVPEMIEYDEDLHAVRRGDGVLLSARRFPEQPPPGVTVLSLEPSPTVPAHVVWRETQAPSTVTRFLESALHTSVELGWAVAHR